MILLILLRLDGDATRLKFGRTRLKISLYESAFMKEFMKDAPPRQNYQKVAS